MSKQDYYDLLGVNRNADTATIKRAYRKQAMKYHPDQNPNDTRAEEKFKQVNEAWEVLQDDQKRSAYDQYGHSAFEQGGAGGGNPFGQGGNPFGADFGDIFSDFFGGGTHRHAGAQPGSDLQYELNITLEDAFNGKTVDLSIATAKQCRSCKGHGGTGRRACATCKGQGAIRRQQGFFVTEQTCPDCHGEGQKIQNPCADCRGQGRVNGTKKLSANIPAGVDNGTRIRLSGEGEAGQRGAANGDLYLFINVQSHNILNRDGNNIHMDMPICFTTACLGGKLEIPTIDGGKVEITVPEGTQAGTRFRVRERGMSILRTKRRGDMFVKVQVEVPTNLSKDQKDKVRSFQDTLKGKNRPNSESILGKIKGFWDSL